jgi:hypothetical protein
MFLAPGATYPGIPPQFTRPAAYGDLVAAVLDRHSSGRHSGAQREIFGVAF